MTSFAVEPIYGSTWVALLIAAITVTVIVRVTPPTDDPSHRRWLVLLRSLAALTLLAAVFRPTFLKTDRRPAEAMLIVAADRSRSMTLPDGDGGDRWTSQQAAWRALSTGLSGVDDSLSLRLLVYDTSAKVLADASSSALDQETPDGDSTDLAAAVLASIQTAGGRPLAGVVMMGDGTQTAPVQGNGAQRIVETLHSLGVPLWSVPLGKAGGDSSARDVAIEALPESLQLFAGNEITLGFQVLTQGLAGVEIPVTLTWIDAAGRRDEAASRVVLPNDSNDLEPFSVALTAPSPGTYRLEVKAATQDGELVTMNNRQVAFVDVREGGGRILYLEGIIREEQLRLRQALRRFPDLDLTYQWIPSDTESGWPVDLGDWFRPGKFDVYVIGDLDAAALGAEQMSQLAEAVANGAGLLMLGGQQTYGVGGYADSPLADVVPILMDDSRRRALGVTSQDQGGLIPGPVEIQLARNHAITDLGGQDPANDWRTLPPQLGASRWVGPKVAPGVQVLLQTSQQEPLLVVGEYGAGRAATVAFDSTYRWWRAGKSLEHRRFWRQMVLWLLSREDTGDDKILVKMDSRRFDRSAPPAFTATVPELGPAATETELVAEVISDTSASIAVPLSTDGGNADGISVSGQLPKLDPGFYRLRVSPSESGSTLSAEEVAFQVIDQSREMARPMADPEYLRQLAQLTADHGGRSFETDEIDALVDTISQRRQRAETPVVEKFRLGDGPGSGWPLFVIFVAALGTEWFLRRSWGIA